MPDDNKSTAKNRLTKIDVIEIAFAGTPAVPKATFQIIKSMDLNGREPVIKSTVFKVDEDKRQVWAYVLVPDEPDHQGDVVTKEDIFEAHLSLGRNLSKGQAKGQGTTENHIQVTDGNGNDLGYIFETAIDTDGALGKARGMSGIDGAWLVGMQVESDEIWKSITEGDITGVSMGGMGVRTPIEDTDKSLGAKIVEFLKSSLTFDDIDQGAKAQEELWRNLESLEWSLTTIFSDPEIGNNERQSKISATVDQFKEKLLGYFAVQKAGREISAANLELLEGFLEAAESLRPLIDRVKTKQEKTIPTEGDDTMSTEQLEKLNETMAKMGETVEGLATRIGEIEEARKSDEEKQAEAEAEKAQAEDPVAKIAESVTKMGETLEGLSGRIEKLEKTPNPPNGSDAPPQAEKVDSEVERYARGAHAIFHGNQD